MTMKKTSARLGAGTLALATVVAGLSFGPAANAAPQASGSTTFKLVYKESPSVWVAVSNYWDVGSTVRTDSEASALAAADELTYDPAAKTIKSARTGSCLYDGDAIYGKSWFGFVADCNYVTAPVWVPSGRGDFVSERHPDRRVTAITSPQGGKPGLLGLEATSAGKPLELVSGYHAFTAAVQSVDVRARTADLSGRAVPGATVIINDTESVTADAVTGEWSYTVMGLKLGKNPIKLEQYEGAGNKTGETSVEADLAIADISATATFLPDVTKSMIIAGSAQAGADVQIFQGDKMIKTVPAADVTGHFSAEIAAPNAGGVQTYTVKQVLDGETAPDPVDVTADFGAAVSIVTPVNDAVHNGGALRFQGRGVAGGKVELREQGKQGVIGTADVLANGIWTINTTNIPGKKATYAATLTGKGNNVTTAAVTLNPDADSAQQPIVNPIGEGSNVIIGTGGTPGATIIVRDKAGNPVGTGTVEEDGSWTVTVPPTLGPGKHDLDVIERRDGNDSTPTPIAVDFGAAIVATDATADDTGIVTFTGTGAADASVEVKGKSGRLLATTTVKRDGTWTAVSTMQLPAMRYIVDAFQTTGIGVKSSAEVSFDIKDTTPIAKPVTFTGPAKDSTVNNPKPVFSGTGEPGAKIIVKGTTTEVADTTVKVDGTWSVQSKIALRNTDYILNAVQVPTNGAAQSTATNSFSIKYTAAQSLIVETPAADSTVDGPRPTFTGKGDPGATIVVAGTTKEVATAVVRKDGTWTAVSTIDLAKGEYLLTVTQNATNGDMEKTTVQFAVK